jgi:amidohydrolase
MPSLVEVDNRITNLENDLVTLRRHLHTNPELSNQEFATSALLIHRLRERGFVVTVRPENTGFFADLTPDGFDAAKHRTVAIRCDLDALPIEEMTGLDFTSNTAGVMHACGHDMHMTVATGVGMAMERNDLPGRLRLVYQHAEEAVPGGSIAMIELGAMKEVDFMLGLHVDPELEVGKIGVKDGAFTAAFDTFKIRVIGRSGHGARPHHCIDPIFVVTQLASALYTSIGRLVDARDPMVFSIGKISGGHAPNIIPDDASIEGSIRTLSLANRDHIQPMLVRICDGICDTYGATYELDLVRGAPAIINDANVSSAIASAGREVLGDENVYRIPLPSMGSEDFSNFLSHAPGAMFRLGVARAGEPKYFLHSAKFSPDEKAIAIGVRVLARAALGLMKQA